MSLLRIKTRREKIIIGALVVIILLGAFAFEYTGHKDKKPGFLSVPLDDAWIHFIYAKSLATTLRLDYNPGQSEAGFTSMLWVILLAPLLLIGLPAPLAAKIIGIAAHIGLAWFIFLLIKRYCSTYLAAGGGFFIAFAPILYFSSLSGMEVMIYAFSMAGALYYFLESNYKTCAVFLIAVALSRPDGIIFISIIWAALIVYILFNLVGKTNGKKVSAIDWALVFALPSFAIASWMAYCFVAIGRPFPSSYYLRAGQTEFFLNFNRLNDIFIEISGSCSMLNHWSKWLMVILGLVFLLLKNERRNLVFFFFPPIFMFLMGGEGLQIIGGTFTGNRYLVPILPFLMALQIFGVALIVKIVLLVIKGGKRQEKFVAPAVLALMATFIIFLPFGSWFDNQQRLRTEFAQSCSNILQMQVAAGKWIKANTASDSVIATFDAGAIRYIGNRQTIDILNLNSHDIPPNDPVVVKDQADFLVTYPEFSPKLIEPYLENELVRFILDDNITCASDTMVIYKVH